MNILVTGSAGAIGSHMAELIHHKGHSVLGLDAFTEYYDPNEKHRTAKELASKGIETRRVDLVTDNLEKELSTNIEFIFHFAAQPGISSATTFSSYVRNNIEATERLLEWAKTLANLKGLLFISTSSVYGAQANGDEKTEVRPISSYGVTKLAAEQLALSYARRGIIPTASARLFSVYGERERPEKLFRRLVAAIRDGSPFPLYDGSRDHKRSYTYVGDITNGLWQMYEQWEKCHGEIFNLGSEEVHTTGEGIDLVERLMDRQATYNVLPPRNGDQLESRADISKARNLLGYSPQTSFEEGLRKEIDWCLRDAG